MVEGQSKAPVAGIDDRRGPGVVAGLRRACGPGDEDRRDGVEARVPPGVGIGEKLAEELDLERCLLAGLADRGRLERLAVVDEAAGEGPAGRRALALDQDDAALRSAVPDLDDDVDGGHGVAVSFAAHSVTRPGGAIVGVPLAACQSPGQGARQDQKPGPGGIETARTTSGSWRARLSFSTSFLYASKNSLRRGSAGLNLWPSGLTGLPRW
jgi:hypothetical protein